MPFSAVQLPSIALTQLKDVLVRRLPDKVVPKIFYINHDFSRYLGHARYALIANSVIATVSGVGDWFFRQVAFPDLPDNTDAYVSRYLCHIDAKHEITPLLVEKRQGLAAFLDELVDQYELDKFSLVGFTSMFIQNLASFAMAKKLKERNPRVITAIGGANCETSMGQVIAKNIKDIDFAFSGPALKSFPQLVTNLIEGAAERCHQITGVYSAEKLAREATNGASEIGEELPIEDEVELDYDDFLASFDAKCQHQTMAPALLFETSRGCWWGERSHCTFCGLNGMSMQYRAMKPEKALAQFSKLFLYAPKVSHFKSVDNILPKEYLTDVFPYVSAPENSLIFYEVKADLKDHELEVLAKAGVREIQPGIEALATSTLKLMKKGTTSYQNINFLKSCLVHGIDPDWNLLIGFPGEKEEVYSTYCELIPLLVHLPPPTGVYPVRFDRFSPYFKFANEYGLQLKPYDFYSMVYPFDEADLHDLAYFFADQNYGAAYIGLTAKWIKKLEAKIAQWQTRWHQGDGQIKPELVFQWRDDNRIVYDSRSGSAVEHAMDAEELWLLDLLMAPMSLADITKKLNKISETDLATSLKELHRKGLVFQEQDRYLSLVAPSNRVQGCL